ncbi:MAG: efflux RND transporter periplasmic adaptor subunit, partial [Steroidobacteraceae bacterium]
HPNLRPGAFARGEVETTRQTRALIPQTAVMTDDGVNFVFLVDEKSRVQRQPIEVASSRPEGVVVNDGLSAGDRVVTLAGPYLRAGETVRVAE